LWINANALVAGNFAKALATLSSGIASPEHSAFANQ